MSHTTSLLTEAKFQEMENMLVKFRGAASNLSKRPTHGLDLVGALRQMKDIIAPMKLISYTGLKKNYNKQTMHKVVYDNADVMVDATELPENARIVFVSHRWWNSQTGEADQVTWPKVKLLLDVLIPKFIEDYNCTEDDVFIWWDFASVHQTRTKLQRWLLKCLPVYISLSDCVFALRAGDENYFSGMVYNSETRKLEEYSGEKQNHPGHYNQRVWTGVEQFVATSEFVREVRGADAPMKVYTVDLDETYNVTSGPTDQTTILQSQLHESNTWSLPPRGNLQCEGDLQLLEPLMVLLGKRTIPRILASGMYNLPVAMKVFLSSGDDVNAKLAETGDTLLHFAASRADVDMVRTVVMDHGASVNEQNAFGHTPLHNLASCTQSLRSMVVDWNGQRGTQSTSDAAKECVKILLEAKADPLIADNHGCSAIDLHAIKSFDESFFPGFELQTRQAVNQFKDPVWFHGMNDMQARVNVTEHRETFKHDGGDNTIFWRCLTPKDGKYVETMVCSPMVLVSGHMYIEFAYRMVISARFRVILLDNPGCGRSLVNEHGITNAIIDRALIHQHFIDPFSNTEAMLDYYLKDVEAVAIKQGWTDSSNPAHFVGCSVSGTFWMHWALKHPERCKSVSWFSCAHAIRHTPEGHAMFQGFADNFASCEESELQGFLNQMIGARATPKMQEMFWGSCCECDMANRMNALSVAIYANLKNVLKFEEVKVPIAVFTGDGDAMFLAHAAQAATSAPHVTCKLVPTVAHVPPLENPEQSCLMILDFLHSRAGVAEGRATSKAIAREVIDEVISI
jgi:pimeloyl-ACP methyl ester carboxylesterase